MAYNTLDFGNISLTDPRLLSALTTADIASLSGIDTLTLTGLGAQGSAGGSNTYNFNQTNWPSITMAGGAGGSGTYANAGFVNPNATGPIIALPATPSSTVPVGTRCPSYPVLRVAAITSPDR